MGVLVGRNNGRVGMKDILSKGVAVDAAHGNAKGTRLQDVMVGEALDELDEISRVADVGYERNEPRTCYQQHGASVFGTRA